MRLLVNRLKIIVVNKYLNSNSEKTDSFITNIGENETALSEDRYNGFRLGELIVLKSNGRQTRIKSYNSVTDTFLLIIVFLREVLSLMKYVIFIKVDYGFYY